MGSTVSQEKRSWVLELEVVSTLLGQFFSSPKSSQRMGRETRVLSPTDPVD